MERRDTMCIPISTRELKLPIMLNKPSNNTIQKDESFLQTRSQTSTYHMLQSSSNQEVKEEEKKTQNQRNKEARLLEKMQRNPAFHSQSSSSLFVHVPPIPIRCTQSCHLPFGMHAPRWNHISIPINNHLPLTTSQILPPDQKSNVVMEKPAHCSPFIKGTASSSGMVRSRQMTMWEQSRGPSASSMRATRLCAVCVLVAVTEKKRMALEWGRGSG